MTRLEAGAAAQCSRPLAKARRSVARSAVGRLLRNTAFHLAAGNSVTRRSKKRNWRVNGVHMSTTLPRTLRCTPRQSDSICTVTLLRSNKTSKNEKHIRNVQCVCTENAGSHCIQPQHVESQTSTLPVSPQWGSGQTREDQSKRCFSQNNHNSQRKRKEGWRDDHKPKGCRQHRYLW